MAKPKKAAKKAAKKSPKKRASAKKGAKNAPAIRMIKKTVKGSNVTVAIKKKGAKKALKSCTRIDIGSDRVVEVCVARKPAKRKPAEVKLEELVLRRPRIVGPGRPGRALQAEYDSDRDRLMGTAPSDGVYRPRKRSKKASKARRKTRR